MSKLPSFAPRSISVRQQREQTLPHLRRSASTYGKERASSPVEIGTKDSILSLVHRDITTCSSVNAVDSPSSKTTNSVWRSRIWLMAKKANPSQKHKSTRLKTVIIESKHEPKTPKWKRLLKKLKGGRSLSKGDGSIKDNLRGDGMSSRGANCPPCPQPPRLQTSNNAPTSLIWERRSVAQITPLDLSHLYTARIKKKLAEQR